jgi:hypothetical protein
MDVDLHELASHLQTEFAERWPIGMVVGRTAFRDAVAEKLHCSQLEAEEQVDQLVALRFLVYAPGGAGEPGLWRIVPDPAAFA